MVYHENVEDIPTADPMLISSSIIYKKFKINLEVCFISVSTEVKFKS